MKDVRFDYKKHEQMKTSKIVYVWASAAGMQKHSSQQKYAWGTRNGPNL